MFIVRIFSENSKSLRFLESLEVSLRRWTKMKKKTLPKFRRRKILVFFCKISEGGGGKKLKNEVNSKARTWDKGAQKIEPYEYDIYRTYT